MIENWPTGKYGTIVADPPWQYRSAKTGGNMTSGAAQKYPVMDLNDIKALPVPTIAAKDSVLFLWATTPLLPDCISVMAAWGYQYKTALFWHKITSQGLGYWFRGQVELCLVGIRGKVKAFRCQQSNFIQAKVGKHSEKPQEFFDLIDDITPMPRIELFARRRRSNWDVWGNQIEEGDANETNCLTRKFI